MFGKTIILAFALLAFVSLSPANAQVEEIVLKVDGMACPMCAYGLEVMLNNVEGSGSVKIVYEEGEALLVWNKGKPFDVSAIWKAVDEAGFTLRSIKGTFVGTVAKDGEWYLLVLPSPTTQRILLFDPSQAKMKGILSKKRGESGGLLSDATRKRLDGLIGGGKSVRIAGLVHFHKDSKSGLPLFLGVDSVEEVADLEEGKPSPASP